jgi:hypothetical protein
MYDNDRIKETYVYNHEWVKRLRKGSDLEDIGKAIQDRIEWPNITGPYIHQEENESSVDIIAALVDLEPDLHDKIEKAVGLMLYKMKHGDIGPSQKIYQGIFSIIRTNQFFECATLVHNWIKENESLVKPLSPNLKFYEREPLEAKRNSFKDALHAFAYVQDKSQELEAWWFNLWYDTEMFYQFYAFIGLRRQNPLMAVKEIPLLLDRKLTNTATLLAWFWRDEASKKVFVNTIRDGVNNNEKWAGIAMNTALEKMWPIEKEELMISLIEGRKIKLIENTTQKVLTNDI